MLADWERCCTQTASWRQIGFPGRITLCHVHAHIYSDLLCIKGYATTFGDKPYRLDEVQTAWVCVTTYWYTYRRVLWPLHDFIHFVLACPESVLEKVESSNFLESHRLGTILPKKGFTHILLAEICKIFPCSMRFKQLNDTHVLNLQQDCREDVVFNSIKKAIKNWWSPNLKPGRKF